MGTRHQASVPIIGTRKPSPSSEVIHHAKNSGVYGDRVMARATFNLTTREQQKD